MRALSQKVLGRLHFTLEQVQDLTPTPMTLSSVMFYTGIDPYTGAPLYVARNQDDKRRQKSYFFRDDQRPSRPQKGVPQRASQRTSQHSSQRPTKGTSTSHQGRPNRPSRPTKNRK